MDFYRPPIENPPHYTLRIEGYSGGREATEHIASQFQPFVWKTFYRASSCFLSAELLITQMQLLGHTAAARAARLRSSSSIQLSTRQRR